MASKDGYVTVATFEKKLWNIKGDVDKGKEELKTECKERKMSTDEKIKTLQTNDQTLTSSLGSLRIDLTKVVSDVDWLKRFFWIVTASSLGALVTGIINLILIT